MSGDSLRVRHETSPSNCVSKSHHRFWFRLAIAPPSCAFCSIIMDLSPTTAPSNNMIDYCAPTIRAERPQAPKRRLPNTSIKRRGTIEFMASFLIGRKSTIEQGEDLKSQRKNRPSQRRLSSDTKPECPDRRGTMEFMWSSLKHMSMRSMREVKNDSEHTTDSKPVLPNRRGTIEFAWGSTQYMSSNSFHDGDVKDDDVWVRPFRDSHA